MQPEVEELIATEVEELIATAKPAVHRHATWSLSERTDDIFLCPSVLGLGLGFSLSDRLSSDPEAFMQGQRQPGGE